MSELQDSKREVISKFTNNNALKALGSQRSKIHRMNKQSMTIQARHNSGNNYMFNADQFPVKEMARIKRKKIGKIVEDLDQIQTADHIQVTVDVLVDNFILKDE